jgi:hypothetical protein
MQPGHLGHPAFFTDQQFQGVMTPQFNFGGFPTSTSSYDPISSQVQSPISPLTTSLPVEAQQVIGTSFDPSGQYTQMFMNMSHGQPVPPSINYTYRPNFGSSSLKSSSDDISQSHSPNPMAAAPSRIDTNLESLATPALTDSSISSAEGMGGQFAPYLGFDCGFGVGMNFDKTSADTITTGTPNDGFFNDWIDAATTDEIAQ